MERVPEDLALIACATSALVAGVFYAFSTFVMRALDRVPAHSAAETMQAINVTVVRPLVMVPLFGTGALCAAVVWAARGHPAGLQLPWACLGTAAYIVGVLLVTVAGNVPLNDRLARVGATSRERADAWGRYSHSWTRWNHVRTVAALVAAGAFAMASRA